MDPASKHIQLFASKSVNSVCTQLSAPHEWQDGAAAAPVESCQGDMTICRKISSSFSVHQKDNSSCNSKTALLFGSFIGHKWLKSSTLLELFWDLTRNQIQDDETSSVAFSFMALNDVCMYDLLQSKPIPIQKASSAQCCSISSMNDMQQILKASSTSVEARAMLKSHVGVIQAVISQTTTAARPKAAYVLRFVIFPFHLAVGAAACTLASVLRVTGVLREASELLRVINSHPALSSRFVIKKRLATASTHAAGVPRDGIGFHLPSRDSVLVQLIFPALLGQAGHSVVAALIGHSEEIPDVMFHLFGDLLVLRPVAAFLNPANSSKLLVPCDLQLSHIEVQAVSATRLQQELHSRFCHSDDVGSSNERSSPQSPNSTSWSIPDFALHSPPSRRTAASSSSISPKLQQTTPYQVTKSMPRTTPKPQSQWRQASPPSNCLSPQDLRAVRQALATAREQSGREHTPASRDDAVPGQSLLKFSAQARLQSAAHRALQEMAADSVSDAGAGQ